MSARIALTVLAALVLLLPLAHSASISDPFGLPKDLCLTAAAVLLLGLMLVDGISLWPSPAGPGAALKGVAAALLIMAGLATLLSANRPLALQSFCDLVCLVVVAAAVARWVRTPVDAIAILGAALAGACLLALVTLAQVFSPGFNLTLGDISIVPPSPAGATLGDPGLVAQFLLIAAPLGLGAAALTSGLGRLLCGAGLGLIASALLYAGRPEGWLAAFWILLLLAATRVVRAVRAGDGWADLTPDLAGSAVRALLVIVAVVVLAVALGRLPGATGQPVAPLSHVSLLAPTTGEVEADRRAASRGSVALLRRHPLGVGPGYWRHAFLEVAWSGGKGSPFTLSHQAVHAGNSFLEAGAEVGLAGGVALLGLLALLLARAGAAAFRDREAWGALGASAWSAILAAIVVACLGSPFQETSPAVLIAVAAGLSVAASRGGRRASTPSLAGRGPGAAVWRRVALLAWVALAAAATIASLRRLETSRLTLSGQSLLTSGDARGALRLLSQPAALRSPEHLPHVLRGQAALRAGAFPEAVAAFGDTLIRSPWFIAARLGRAAAEESLGHYDRAADDLEAALGVWPGSYDILLARGRLDTRRGRLEQALVDYREAAAANPTLGDAWFAQGDLYARRGQYDQAIEAFHVCLEKNPRFPHINLRLGDAYEKRGMIEMALGHMQREALIDERAVEPRLRMANIFHMQGQDCEARLALEAARDLETDAARRETLLKLIDQMDAACRQSTARRQRR